MFELDINDNEHKKKIELKLSHGNHCLQMDVDVIATKKQLQTVCISLCQLKLKLISICGYHSNKPSNESEVYKVIRVNTRGWINLQTIIVVASILK